MSTAPVDKFEVYRAKANAAREKAANRVSGEQVEVLLTDFLNSDNESYRENMRDKFPKSMKDAAVLQRLKTKIRENKLDELVYPIIDNGVTLVKLV